MKQVAENKKTQQNLLWLDMEMSGLNPQQDTILEVATIVTNNNLEPIDQGFSVIINHPEKILKKMDEWNIKTHSGTGLYEKVLKSKISITEAEKMLLSYAKKHLQDKSSPLCGNTIWQDRMFLIKHMVKFNEFMHYRNIDVSTIKELAFKWYPDLAPFVKKGQHSAMADIKESLAELKYYRHQIFINSQN